MWTSGVSVYIYRTLLIVKRSKTGHSMMFSIFDNLFSRTRLVIERNGAKFGPRGQVQSVHKVLMTFLLLSIEYIKYPVDVIRCIDFSVLIWQAGK